MRGGGRQRKGFTGATGVSRGKLKWKDAEKNHKVKIVLLIVPARK